MQNITQIIREISGIDGMSLISFTKGDIEQRDVLIGFTIQGNRAWINDRYLSDTGNSFELYDLSEDPFEKHDCSKYAPDKVTVNETGT